MSYCENCGNRYSNPKNYCRICGDHLSPTLALTTGPLIHSLSEEVATGIERGHRRVRRRQIAAEGSNDSANLYMSCLAVVAMLQGASYMAGGKINLLNGQLALLLYAGIAIAAIFKIMFDLRYGYSLSRSLIEVILFGALAYVGVFAIFWYFTNNYLHTGKPILNFPNFPIPTPTIFPTK